jgi:hypothetical protein
MDSQKSQSSRWDEWFGAMILGIEIVIIVAVSPLFVAMYLFLKCLELPILIPEFIFKLNVIRLANKKDVEGLIKALRWKDWRYNTINNSIARKAAAALELLADERAIEPLNQYEIQCQAEQDIEDYSTYQAS